MREKFNATEHPAELQFVGMPIKMGGVPNIATSTTPTQKEFEAMSFHKPPEEKLVRRAAQIWRQLIENPKFDNGDKSLIGGIDVAPAESIPTKTSPEAFDKFEEFIFQKMMTPLSSGYYPNLHLVVDYGPAKALSDAAWDACLKIQFPWKTSVRVETNCVQVRSGDSSPCVSHYPLPDGRWLVTTLSGGDIDKVINHIMTGEPLGLTITE